MADNTKYSLSEASLVKQLTDFEGWKILATKWRERYRNQLLSLRKKRKDETFYRCQGYLNAIEEMFLDVNQTLTDTEFEIEGGE
jgi:predicted nuclease of restriction endonuclease-like RecB superfamily